jgi:hypothetical protein
VGSSYIGVIDSKKILFNLELKIKGSSWIVCISVTTFATSKYNITTFFSKSINK